MTYIRTKKISDNHYAYLVENLSTPRGPRQKVKQYLGKVYHLDRKPSVKTEFEFKNKTEFLLNLIIPELESFNFKLKQHCYHYQILIFDMTDFSVIKQNKNNSSTEAVIRLNDGYLCTFTLQRLVNFQKSGEFKKDGYELAQYFLEAGLQISQEEFVRFYKLL